MPENDFSFIDKGDNLGDFQPMKTVDAGEHEVVIEEVHAPSPEMVAEGKTSVRVVCAVDNGDPFTKNVTHFVSFPNSSDDDKKRNGKKIRLDQFFRGFSISESDWYDPNQWLGHRATVMLKLAQTDEYGEQNSITKFVGVDS